MYEFQMKKPRPPPALDWIAPPPPEIISAATTTFQVIPMPTSQPTMIEGSTPGRTMRRKMSQLLEPIERAAWKKRMSIERAPPITLSMMVKMAPRKITKPIDSSCVGQKMIAAGTQASGGTGRRISKTGKVMSRKMRLVAIARPNGMPIIIAARKPESTRRELWYQLYQY